MPCKSVNESFADFGVVPNDSQLKEPIRFGLGAIKNVGHGAAEIIVRERKTNGLYQNLVDFLKRHDQKIINRKTIESLIQAGAFDGFAERGQLMMNIETILRFANGLKTANSAQIGLFGESESSNLDELQLAPSPAITKEQKMLWEKAILGIYLSEHPLGNFRREVGTVSTPIGSITDQEIGKTVRVLGIITQAKNIITKSNAAMCFVKIDDATGTLEVVVFPNLMADSAQTWRTDRVVIVDGVVNDKDGAIKILADAVWDITDLKTIDDITLPPLKPKVNGRLRSNHQTIKSETPTQPQLLLRLPRSADQNTLIELKKIIAENAGETKILLEIPQNDGWKEMKIEQSIMPSPPVLHKLTTLLGPTNCTLE